MRDEIVLIPHHCLSSYSVNNCALTIANVIYIYLLTSKCLFDNIANLKQCISISYFSVGI